MTLPYERTNSILKARALLIDLLDSKATPRVPRGIRKRAADALRHFPTPLDIETAGGMAPSVFSNKYRFDLSGRNNGKHD